ncbi:MAG: hypothetical protein KJZ74_09560 [Gemmatimonadales bacterium]|nr:hypothetical protein [Gemmatimonadota bacterium]MCL4214151.1 hypothetical protein [Gemmatimonadales bacterium]
MRASAAVALLALAAAGCASASNATPETGVIDATGALQYDGQFRPVQQSDGRVGMSTVQRIYGDVRILFREATDRSRVTLSLNTNNQQSEVLAWAVVPGRCGSGGVPLLPAAQFPPLEITNTGRGEVAGRELPLSMPSATYHVNVYRGGETLSNVIACANLQLRR